MRVLLSFLLECRKRKIRPHGIRKNGNYKHKNRANKRDNTRLRNRSLFLPRLEEIKRGSKISGLTRWGRDFEKKKTLCLRRGGGL